jgi:CubicO group peptidase (beta-lactamase class C family)
MNVPNSKILKRLACTSLLAIMLAGCFSGKNENLKKGISPRSQEPEYSLPDDEKKKYYQLVANFLDSTLLRGSFNGSILVAKNGVPVYEEYIGYRDIRTKDTLTAESPQQIASTSKPFTAGAILRLAQEGKLSLHDPVENYFPGFPYAGITIKSLLTHRSGLPNYLYYMEKGGWKRNLLATNEDVLNTLINWRPPQAYKPESNFNYCNTNYVLLALIVEKVSGQSFPDYMQANFFEPLNMTNTFVHTISDSARIAPSFDGYSRLWQHDFSDGPYGDKNIYSTPRDLLKWDQAWYNESVVNQSLKDSAFIPYSNERPSVHNYGLGWRLLVMPEGKKVVYHNGRWHGFNSSFARLPDEKVTIIILTNKFNRNIYSVARKMYNLFGDYDGRREELVE